MLLEIPIEGSSRKHEHSFEPSPQVNIPSKSKSVVRVTLRAQAEGLKTLEEEERSEWVEGSSEITKDLYASFDDECDGPEGLAELETMVTLRGLCEGREFPRLGPVELACEWFVRPIRRYRYGSK